MSGKGLSRRSFLIGASTTAISAAVLRGDTAIDGFARLEADAARERFTHGPFSHGSASSWLSKHELRITSRLGPNQNIPETFSGLQLFDDTTNEKVAQTLLKGNSADDYRVGHTFADLDPKRRYRYEFNFADSKETLVGYSRSPEVRALSPFTGEERSFERYVFVSCMNYGAGYWDMMSHIEAMNPDMVLFIGDSIYEKQANSNSVRHDIMPDASDYELFLMRHWVYNDAHKRKLLGNIPGIFIPDDHEFRNNFGTSGSEDIRVFKGGSRAFSATYPCLPNTLVRGFQRTLNTPNGTRLICLDTRSFRDPSNGTMLGNEQLQWLLDQLTIAKVENASNTIVVTSVSFVSALERLMDSWPGFERERQHIIDHIAKLDLRNVSFVSGDLHEFYASGVHLDPGNKRTPIVAREFGTGAISSRTSKVGTYNGVVDVLGNGNHGVTVMDVYPSGDKIVSWVMSDARKKGSEQKTGARFYVPDQKEGGPVRISLQAAGRDLVRNPGKLELLS